MLIQTNLNIDDFEVLSDFCNSERVSVSALLKTLVVDFLDSTDTERRLYIMSEAKKIKQGRPKECEY